MINIVQTDSEIAKNDTIDIDGQSYQMTRF